MTSPPEKQKITKDKTKEKDQVNLKNITSVKDAIGVSAHTNSHQPHTEKIVLPKEESKS